MQSCTYTPIITPRPKSAARGPIPGVPCPASAFDFQSASAFALLCRVCEVHEGSLNYTRTEGPSRVDRSSKR